MAKDVRRGINKLFREAAEEFARRAIGKLGNQIHSIILFGSVARKQATRESDVDLLVISDDGTIRSYLVGISGDISDACPTNVLVTTVLVSTADFDRLVDWGSPFFRNVFHEGVVLYDDGTYSTTRSRALAPRQRNSA